MDIFGKLEEVGTDYSKRFGSGGIASGAVLNRLW